MQEKDVLIVPGRRGEAGFTLIETMVAVVVLAFGLIAVSNLLVVASTSNSVANQSTAATTQASRIMEELKGASFGDPRLAIGGDLDADVPSHFQDDLFPGVGTVHSRWQIEATPTGQTIFIRVRSEGMGILSRGRSRAEFTAFRSCTNQGQGCPAAVQLLAP